MHLAVVISLLTPSRSHSEREFLRVIAEACNQDRMSNGMWRPSLENLTVI